MWRPRNNNPHIVTITAQPTMLTCSIITPSSSAAAFQLHAYEQHSLTRLELEQGYLYNPTRIAQHITSFVKKNKGQNAFIACALQGQGIQEYVITMPHAHHQRTDFKIPALATTTWDYHMLCPTDHGQWLFHVASINNDLLLQWQLMVTRAHLNLLAITTKRTALLQLYRYHQGAAFRQTKFAQDIAQQHRIEQWFTADMSNRILHIPPSHKINRETEAEHLMAACGLLVAQGVCS
jgi:hypothetical protein